MSTRGLFGFRVNGVDKLTYNHYDSYPSNLGQKMCDLARKYTAEKLREYAIAMRLVSSSDVVTQDDLSRYGQWANLSVSNKSPSDWYCLLHETFGKPELILRAGAMIGSADFIADSLFCEWAYIINLDAETLEVYKGFQSKPHACGRYATLPQVHSGYYPCKLIAEFKLSEIPKDLESVIYPQDEDGN